MSNAYRCSTCLTSWPHTLAYEVCPECECHTDAMRDESPIDAAEAKSRKAHADFRRHLIANGQLLEGEAV